MDRNAGNEPAGDSKPWYKDEVAWANYLHESYRIETHSYRLQVDKDAEEVNARLRTFHQELYRQRALKAQALAKQAVEKASSPILSSHRDRQTPIRGPKSVLDLVQGHDVTAGDADVMAKFSLLYADEVESGSLLGLYRKVLADPRFMHEEQETIVRALMRMATEE